MGNSPISRAKNIYSPEWSAIEHVNSMSTRQPGNPKSENKKIKKGFSTSEKARIRARVNKFYWHGRRENSHFVSTKGNGCSFASLQDEVLQKIGLLLQDRICYCCFNSRILLLFQFSLRCSLGGSAEPSREHRYEIVSVLITMLIQVVEPPGGKLLSELKTTTITITTGYENWKNNNKF